MNWNLSRTCTETIFRYQKRVVLLHLCLWTHSHEFTLAGVQQQASVEEQETQAYHIATLKSMHDTYSVHLYCSRLHICFTVNITISHHWHYHQVVRSWFQMFILVCLYDLHILMKHQIVSIMKAWHPYNKMCCRIRAPSKRGRHACVLLLGISHPNNHIVFGVTIGTYWVFYRMVMVWNYIDYLRGDFDYIILSVLHDSWQNKLLVFDVFKSDQWKFIAHKYKNYIVSSMEKLLTKYRVYSNTIVVCVDKKDHIDTFSSRWLLTHAPLYLVCTKVSQM